MKARKALLDPFEFGRLMGFNSAKAGSERKCPYLPEKTEEIRGWLQGYDEFPGPKPCLCRAHPIDGYWLSIECPVHGNQWRRAQRQRGEPT